MKNYNLSQPYFYVIFISICNIIVLTPLLSQSFCKTYGGTHNDGAWQIIRTTDGGYITAGHTYTFGNGNNTSDMYIVKISSIGDLQWSKTIGGTNDDGAHTADNINSIVQCNNGDYIVVGSTWSYGAGNEDIYLLRLDNAGNLLWTKTIGSAGGDDGYSIIQTTDGGFAIGGYTNYCGTGADCFITKLDNTGSIQWTKVVGGIYLEFAYSIAQTNDGGYILGGQTGSFGAGLYDVYIVKLDNSGMLQWTKTVGGANYEAAESIIQTIDGGYAIAGRTNSYGAGNQDMYLVKLDNTGALQWTKTIGGGGYDIGNSIIQTTDGGYAVAGWTQSFGAGMDDMYIVKLDNTGSLQWTKTIGGTNNDKAFSILQTNDGSFVIAGWTFSFGQGSFDVYLVKLDNNGNTCASCNSNVGGSIGSGGTTSNGGTIGNCSFVTGNGGSVGSGGLENIICSTMSVYEFDNNINFLISPNPFSSQTTLQSDNLFQSATLTVYNSFGQTVKQIKNISGRTITLSRDNLPCGLYFVRLTSARAGTDGQDNQNFATCKLIISDGY